MALTRSADHSLMREMNIALLLECLHRQSPQSRASLARLTGLTKATVSSLVVELLDAKFIEEIGETTGEMGRPSIQIQINPTAGYILGAEIQVDCVMVVLADFAANIVWRKKHRITNVMRQEDVLNLLEKIIFEAIQLVQEDRQPVLGLGLGLPGLVDASSGVLLFAPNLAWKDVPIRQTLQRRFPFPVFVDNEANMAALGESFFGAAQHSNFFIYVSAAEGVGAGIILDQRVLNGASGMAGEVGHMTIDPNGPPCNCGNCGCWETYINLGAVVNRVRSAMVSGQYSTLVTNLKAGNEHLTFLDIVEAARQKDAVALQALAETGRFLGIGLANLINTFNPECIILGGKLSLAHPFLLPEAKRIISERALFWPSKDTEIIVSKNGEEACLMGAIAVVYHQVLARPMQMSRQVSATTPC